MLFFVGIAIALVSSMLESDPDERRSLECSDEKIAWRAPLRAEAYVKERLVSPKTAEFGGQTVSLMPSPSDSICNYTIIGFVDAQNSFGAMVRSEYGAKVRYNKDEDTWSLVEVAIDS